MTEESIDNVLKKATTERKPLSEEEKREAMEAGKEVWRTAMEATKGRRSVDLKLEDLDCSILIYIYNPRHKESKHSKAFLQDPDTDLVISVFRQVRDERGISSVAEMDRYEFAPGKVTKLEMHPGQTDINKYLSIKDPFQAELAMRNDAKREKEQRTEERYHPDKEDLQNLLSVVSSAKELLPSSVKVVPWPK